MSRLANRRRILVIGNGGAGKSTFARQLSERTGLPVVHLDFHFWKPGWVQPSSDEWQARLRELLDKDAWVMDGNYGNTLSWRISRCDVVVFLDLPRHVCLWGVLKRLAMCPFMNRPDMAPGCSERFDPAFLRWIWNFPRDSRPRLLAALETARADVEIIFVTTRAQARNLLSGLVDRQVTATQI